VRQVSPGHLQHIDILRGIAIAGVIMTHYRGAAGYGPLAYTNFWFDVHKEPVTWWLFYPLIFGWTGVALFFVISGYVIHRSYLRDHHFTWRKYASRRFWRIYPPYAVALIGFALWLGVPFWSQDFTLHAMLLHNVKDATFFGSINSSFWSLAVECQLYALYPVALFMRRRAGLHGMLVFGCLASAIWTLGAYRWIDLPFSNDVSPWSCAWSSPLLLWPSWLLGAVLAECHLSGRRLFSRWLTWAIAAATLCVLASCSRAALPLQFLLASLSWAAIVDAYLSSRNQIGRWLKPLGLLGLFSYSAYLIHQPLTGPFVTILSHLGVSNGAAQIVMGMPLFFVLIFGFSWAMYLLIEQPSRYVSFVYRNPIKVGAPRV
jgi:peptidoglycan/LPS O-acetylase OafA/YrhL